MSIAGKHAVLRGPQRPDVFQPPEEGEHLEERMSVSEEILKEGKNIQVVFRTQNFLTVLNYCSINLFLSFTRQDEIKLLLTETVTRASQEDPLTKSSSRRFVCANCCSCCCYCCCPFTTTGFF